MNKTDDVELIQEAGMAPPFPGLRPFASRDHKFFFGREDQVFALYRLLRNNHLVAVIGSSGSGKSSIVDAGLLPLLDEENDQSEKNLWQCTIMRPGRDPISHLASALAKNSGEFDTFFEARRDRIAAVLRASSNGISEALAHSTSEASTQVVLVVDQFEELFRYLSAGPQAPGRFEMARRREEAINFVQLLLAATRSYHSRVRVVITMRSDFIGDCARFQGLPEAVSAAQFLVPSLSRDQREEAIRRPIELSGATIDSELVERLLNDSSEELDQLPVLQHCLARLWMRAGSTQTTDPPSASLSIDAHARPDSAIVPVRHLTEQDYRDIGGLVGALSGHADEIYSSLPDKAAIVEKIFQALAEIDKESRAIRRALPLSQLIAEIGADQEVVCAVLDQFRADDCSFIMPPLSLAPSSELPSETIIDVGHEALLRRWTRVGGDPEATGERGDKREIGWLKKEQKDGEWYQFLRSCVDPDSPNDQLPTNQIERYSGWWRSRKPNPAWAARYGGKFNEVDRLIVDSDKANRRSRWRRRRAYAATAVVVTLLGLGTLYLLDQKRQAENTFKLAVGSAEKFSRKILETFNSGQLKTSGAIELQKITADIYRTYGEVRDTPETSILRTAWLLTDSDLEDALGDKKEVRANVGKAENDARKYLDLDPGNRRWQELLYGSLFRSGDLDLEQYINEHNPKLFDQALAEYEEGRLIADKIAATEPKTEMANVDDTAAQKFDLAFIINKVGEATQVRGDIEGALKRYNEALDLAVLIEGATRMDCKLQSATTRIKIANALLARTPADIDGALRNYSEAIEREEGIFAEDKSNNIVRSNLAGAYDGRAQAFEKHGQFDLAFKGYADAASMFSRLVDEDVRDTKWLERLARVDRKLGDALESYARSRNEPLDKAIEQYKSEVAVRGRLAERDPSNTAWRNSLRESQERLQRLQASNAVTPGKSSAAE